ncbi:kelch-like protein [Cotia virus SPAn232]|uniref:Kelch-like protein n=2 Tax=Cotia virus TaxID=39444 RepID=H6TAD9_9POXV|nr:kelch-like protein [Cotia virus SPAn232]YP_005296359.1 kelch-like protein [Cotia virus SPAn232]AIT70630.1 kelch-like protein [Cotia virus]AFB76905.1 kelch-like protein [Cotia virus SPAn232]AFB76973.1 kelch-like protein [Cotia virus SPAn232]AIT70786.1 kelch-like protein [Cotia virus]
MDFFYLKELFDEEVTESDRDSCIRHVISSWRYMKKFLDKEIFCDVTFITNDEKTIKAHKVVLSCTTYFEKLFADNNKEYKLDFSYTVLKTIIDFLYNGHIYSVDVDYISEIFDAIEIMELDSMVYILQEILESETTNGKGLIIYKKLYERFKFNKEHKDKNFFIIKHIEKGFALSIRSYFKNKNKEFIKTISVDTMYNILNMYILDIYTEDEACNMLIEWITEYPNDAKRLIPAIRWSYVSSEMLKELKDNPIIKESGHDIVKLHKIRSKPRKLFKESLVVNFY